MPKLVEDKDLLAAFQRGEKYALEEVYREYAPLVFSILRKGFVFTTDRGPMRFQGFDDPFDLENAMQEVFVRALSKAARQGYDGQRPFGRYLSAIARNLVHDEFRKKERLFEELDQAKVEEISRQEHVQSIPGPDRQAQEQEVRARVGEFKTALDGLERRIFEHRFEMGMSIERTAMSLEVTEHRVKKVERRLKKRFFLQMKEHGYFEGYRLSRNGVERIGAMLCMCLGGRL
ncbi:MAG: sigma-70 family RNA polymerase sigma factor [Deltaproteobacteria bacterium]|nr:sigma-70 family RNA polymerase sigma factor [Deltaproteobacteria bacterium]